MKNGVCSVHGYIYIWWILSRDRFIGDILFKSDTDIYLLVLIFYLCDLELFIGFNILSSKMQDSKNAKTDPTK